MKINEVPQDSEEYKGKSEIRKILYATDSDGDYTTINSDGWEVENLATKQAWEEIEERLLEHESNVRKGKISPIAYFMEKSLMDISMLAKYMGVWKWTIKKHFKPSNFARLNDQVLEKYATIFNITVEELKQFGK